MYRKLIIVLLILTVLAKDRPQSKSAVLEVKPIDLPLNSTKTFLFKNLNETKSLMITVQPNPDQNFTQFLLIIPGKVDKTQCKFKYSNNLCVLGQGLKQASVEMRCLVDRCKVNLIFSQRNIIKNQQSIDFKKKLTLPGSIFKLNKRQFNSILEIYAQRQEHRILSQEIMIYSNIHIFTLNQIEELDANNAIYGVKPIRKQQEEYIYIDSSSKKSEFFTISIRSHHGELRDSITIVDFNQNYGNHSKNKYTFTGEIHKNIQINLRVFSPRDNKNLPFSLLLMSDVKQIGKLNIQPIKFDGHNFYDFSYILSNTLFLNSKQISLLIQLGEINDKAIFYELGIQDTQIFSISIFDHIFFSCGANQSLKFIVQPQVKLQLSQGDKQIPIITQAKQKYFTSISSCSLQKGCEIIIKTQKQCNNCRFSHQLNLIQTKNHILYYQITNNTIEGKIQLEQQLYFKYPMNGKTSTQIIVNSNNVIIYGLFQNYQRCKFPTPSCHQYAITHQNPLVIHNKEQKPQELIIGVVGLEKTSFIVRFLSNNQKLQVKLGERFTYLMDSEEKDLQILFQVNNSTFGPLSQHLYFNLVSPIHSLRLTITTKSQQVQSIEGYTAISRSKINIGQLLHIKIQKINLYYDEYVHFTLFITTSQALIRLDPSTTHYQHYLPKAQKKFLFEYNPNQINTINIYTQKLSRQKGIMYLQIKQVKQYPQQQIPTFKYYIYQDYLLIDLNTQLSQLQICQQNCQLQLSIISQSSRELDQSITILTMESIIGLDDSIWNVFQINQLTRGNHFYFIPRNINNTIKIIFNTDDNHLYLNYRIFNMKNTPNPTNWPYTHTQTAQAGHISNTQQITIRNNDPQLLKCQPNCVILINLNQAYQINEDPTLQHKSIKSYRILATNNIFQLQQDIKLQFTLRQQQQKNLFILASSILKYQKLTFFTYYTFGRSHLSASIISKGQQYQLDISFNNGNLQTTIPIHKIISLITLHRLSPQQVLIKIIILAQTNVKMTIEYTCLLKSLYRLKMDDLQMIALRRNQSIWYQFLPERDFTMKLYRIKGFPLFKVVKCNQSNYIDCLNKNTRFLELKAKEFIKMQEKLRQGEKELIVQAESNKSNNKYLEIFVEKSYQFSQQQCGSCIFFLWIYCFEGDLEMTVNLRSKGSQIELKEMSVVNDRLESSKHNRYLINILPNKDTIVTIRILQGTATVTITYSTKILFNQTLNSVDQDYRDFTIQSQVESQEQSIQSTQSQQFGQVRRFDQQNVFKHAHVTITSSSQKPVQFLISYSVGSSSIYLEDGIVLQKYISPNTQHTFYYHNKNKKQHAYLSLSSQLQSQQNNKIQTNNTSIIVKFYYYPDSGNRLIKELFQPELPPNQNQNYLGSIVSHVYQLPVKYQLYQIVITTHVFMKIVASINHQELVYLPLGYQYLIKLQEKQVLNLVIDRPESQYLEVKIKKCDESIPSLKYTNDADQSKKGIFEAQIDIDHNNFKQYIKTKKTSKTLHLRLIGSSQGESLMTISVLSTSKQMRQKTINYKPGNNGIITYKLLQTNLVEISFKPILCNNKQCTVPFNYYLVIGQTISQIYGELNCANTYFIPQTSKLLNKIKIQVIVIDSKYYDNKKGEYKYQIKLNDKQEFLGIKGVIEGSKEQVQYIPLEIHNFWGELSKISFQISIMISIGLAVVFTIVIVVSTKLARRGYKPIASEE